MEKIIIEGRDLVRTYRTGKSEPFQALRGASLAVPEGDFVSLIGASGSGKSTLLHILGFMDRPTSGSLIFKGRRIENLADAEMTRIRRDEIGFIFQTFNLIPSLSAWENVAFPAAFRGGVPARQRKEKAMALLEMVGLADRAKHRPSELSGGQRQRVAIARALINDPDLLLADEPTGNLDSRTGEQIVHLLQTLNEQGQTIILVTHNPEIAARSQTIYRMKDGNLVGIKSAEYALAD